MDRVDVCGCRSGIASIVADMCPVHLKAERFSEVPDKILSALVDIYALKQRSVINWLEIPNENIVKKGY